MTFEQQQTFSFSSTATWLFIVAFTGTQRSTFSRLFFQSCTTTLPGLCFYRTSLCSQKHWETNFFFSVFFESLNVLGGACYCFLPRTLWFCGGSGGDLFCLFSGIFVEEFVALWRFYELLLSEKNYWRSFF